MRNFIIAILLLTSSCLYAQNQPTFEQAWQAAQKGDPNGYFLLGFFYYQGEGVTQNFTEAIKWFKKAANNGLSNSYGFLGACYITQKNYVEAINWFKKAINNGDCCYADLGACYLQLGKFTEAIPWLKKGIDDKRPEYYVSLGQCYYFLQNYTEAIPWLKKAADKGITDSYFTLGLSFYFLKNYTEAIIWLEKAANNGVSQAYAYLGQTYYEQQNYAEAFKWAKKAVESKAPAAYGFLGSMYLYGKGTSKNPNEAFKWTSKAVENGDIASNTGLGIMYLNGLGTERNEQKAFECFEKTASAGDPVACSWLGVMYMNGIGTPTNKAQGFKWTKEAAEKGYIDSYISLGSCYEFGTGTEKNINEAINCYKKANEKGNEHAASRLCAAYYISGDYAEAKKWSEVAITKKEDFFVGYRILALLNIYGLGVPQNKDKAFELMRQALDGAKETNLSMPMTLDTEGELYLADNNLSKAREIYNAILKETPDFYTQKETKLSKFMKEHKGSDVDFDIPMANNVSNHTFAVVISNEKYQIEKSVQYAENDGKAFAEYCKKTLGLPEKNVRFITNATLNNIKHEIKWLQDVIAVYNGDAKVIFYYAGHGIPDEQNKSAYLLPIDGYGSDVTTGYALEDLYKALGSLPSKSVTVFLDACFSGAKRDGDMLASARGVAIKVKQNNPTGNMVVFTAAQGDETAYPYKEEGHGLFTYYLLKKLQETKGDVTLGELGDYIKTQVERQSIVTNGKLQSPAILSASSIGNSWKEWKLNK